MIFQELKMCHMKYVSRAVKSNLNTSNLLEFLEENTLWGVRIIRGI